MEAIAPWPSGLTSSAINHVPRHLRNDAMQEAWLALHEGRKPDSAVRALLRHEERHRAAKPNFDLCRSDSIRKRF